MHRLSGYALALVGLASINMVGGCGNDSDLTRLVPVISVDQETLNFDIVPIGATRRIQLTVENVGGLPLEISSIRPLFTGTGLNPFDVTVPGPRQLAPGERLAVDVLFTPVLVGRANAALTIESNDNLNSTVEISLTGQGTTNELVVQPPTINLRNTTVGVTRTAELVVQNLGIEPVEGRLVTEGFARPEHFRITGLARFDESAPFGVDTRVRQVLLLTYEPQALGDDNGIVRIELCGPRCGPEVRIEASATEAVLRMTPAAIDFGGVGIGRPQTATIEVENIGTMAATIQSVTAAGSPAFTVRANSTVPSQLAPNQRLQLEVTFTPTEATQARGTVVVETNLGTVPEIQASLVGQGEGPLFFVRPQQLSFGVEEGEGTYVRRALLVNAGSSQVQLSSIGIVGDPELSLGPIPGLPLTLGPGESLVLPVEFRPEEEGAYQATVAVTTDDITSSMVTIPVSAGMAEAVCLLDVTPGRLLFGVLPPTHARSRQVTLTNIGNRNCTLETGFFRAPEDPAMTIVDPPPFPVELVPTSTIGLGETSVTLTFQYAPTDARSAKASYVVRTNDIPEFSERTISLAGESNEQLSVLFRPNIVDFGAMVPELCPPFTNRVTLINTGLNAIVHRQSVLTSTMAGQRAAPEFLIADGRPGSGERIPAGETRTYQLTYQADAEGTDVAELEVTLDGFPQPFVIRLEGEGSPTPRREETFFQLPNKEVDVLFVIDDSCSMEENQRNLSQNFARFIDEANRRQVDFRLGITTTDTTGIPGQLVGPVISRQTPNFQEVFRTQAAVGTRGSGTERGLEAMRGALEEARFGNAPNRDLIRLTSSLVVIIVTDEDDQSDLTAAQYANDLLQQSPNGVLTAVVSGQRQGCIVSNQAADPAPTYETFLSFFNNSISASICADWGQTLAELGGRAFGLRSRFRLAIEPAEDPPPRVLVNDVPVSASEYAFEGDELVFMTPPPESASIFIEYVPNCL